MVEKKKQKHISREGRLEEKMTGFKLPSFNFGLKNTILLSVLVVVAFFAYAWLFRPFDLSFKTEENSTLLVKNTVLQLFPGDKYAYEYFSGNQSRVIDCDVKRVVGGCTLLSSSSSSQGRIEACVRQDGALQYAKAFSETGEMNLSSLDFFQEWMLALNESWEWSWTATSRNDQLEIIQSRKLSLKVVNVTEFKGRKAFAVREVFTSSLNGREEARSEQLVLVDFEKRVLLRSESVGVRVELKEAPFDLSE
ncbi:hypothetical protein HY992_06180 [Candidatus Micrarchaeota archaeon]|nr:hypothetical protein [Candidatus Micrarchaeota archaeon]